jgi:hypothetical protein
MRSRAGGVCRVEEVRSYSDRGEKGEMNNSKAEMERVRGGLSFLIDGRGMVGSERKGLMG